MPIETTSLVIYAVIDLPGPSSIEASKASLTAAIQAGLGASVRTLDIHTITPASSPITTKGKESVIEDYLHCGMRVKIFARNADSLEASFFATVSNPAARLSSGSVFGNSTSLQETRRAAEARAEHKALRLANRVQGT